MASRDSDRISPENSGDEGGSKIRLSGPNNLDPPTTHIHSERLELKNSHEVLRGLGLCTKTDIIIPKKGDMCHEPPSGYFTTYLDYFSNGFSLPPSALLIEIVRSLGVSFRQLTPNAIIAFICFRRRVSQTRIPVTLDLFHALFSAHCTGPGSYIYFQPKLDCKFLSRIRSPRGNWKSNFLYVRDRGWGCPLRGAPGLVKSKLGERTMRYNLNAGR
ncbi:hypothetical protein F511_37843 [Dorcoceras hygrometricum]|uniref:Transposase (putative) gypsy type domain-containing protein n=1 Tax=Dorcoceras hygrometricum TaxID=472368 RepID=A0A2Z7A6J8_9LAMI|nr:hypothetical protein F511_37843 [Dorcoceras hygrometricum]